MPLVDNTGLPSYRRLREEGTEVLEKHRAQEQDIRELHIGLLNMMPDAALEPTERQFLRLIDSCNRIAQFYVYPFSPAVIPRGDGARRHIDQYYFEFDALQEKGLDALIISGANPISLRLENEPFWEPLGQVLDWASEHVTSTLCACLATHAALKIFHGMDREPLGFKRWGVFAHRPVDRTHPLVRDVNTRFDVPHSRFNEIYSSEMRAAGLRVLIESDRAGVHLATSADGFRFVYFQGHPEYDAVSLLKEYKREVVRFLTGDITEYPPFPEGYFSNEASELLDVYRLRAMAPKASQTLIEEFPEKILSTLVDNTWRDTGKAVFNNWLGTVYQITDRDRRVPFMKGVDPSSPLAHLL